VLLLPYSAAYSAVLDLPDRPDSAPTWTFKGPSGGTLESGTSSLDAVSTTLGGAVAAGATSFTVASATGITAGRSYLLTGTEDAGGERVTVRAISGTTVTPVRPVRLAHANGAAFKSTRVTVALTATSTATVGRHHRLELAWAVSSTTQPPLAYAACVCRFYPTTHLTFADVQALDPAAGKRLAAGVWFPEVRDRAWSMLTNRVATKADPGAVVGALDLTIAHAYLCRELMVETSGEDWQAYRELMAKRCTEELDAALAATTIDTDQDGAIASHEGAFRGVELLRA
jgi:hypothetical protein